MKTVKLAVLLSILALWGCTTGRVVTDVDQSINFSQYRTYTWAESDIQADSLFKDSKLIDKHIRSITDYELSKRGMIKDSLQPDLQFQYTTQTEEKDITVNKRVNYPMTPIVTARGTLYLGPWITDPTWAAAMNRPHTEKATEGKLILDVTDTNTGQVVWTGAVSGELDNRTNLQKDITRSVEALLKKLPMPVAQEHNGKTQHRSY